MRKIIMYYVLVMTVVSPGLSCMEHVLDLNKKKDNEVVISDLADEDQKKIKPIVDQSPNSPKDNNRFNLDLGNLTKNKSVRKVPETPKASITSHKQLAEQINGVKQSHRQTQSDRRSSSPKDNDSPKLDGIPKSSTILKKRSMLPPVLVARELANESVKQDPIEEKMWNLVNAANPSLHKFAQEHKMDLDSVIIYGTLLNEMKIKPGVLDEFLNDHHNLNVQDSHKAVIQGYKKIKKENPEYWTTLLLEMFKELDGQENGATTPSALTNINGTQIGLLHDQIAVEKNDKFKLLVVVGVKFVIMLAGGVWILYEKINGAVHPCTHAPTYMPINSSMYGPTQAPI